MVLRVESTHREIEAVRGVTTAIRNALDARDYGAVEVAVSF